ncbi:pectinesterase-like [Coffea arabica]|uniref:Pectinesterase n=1 Tax=Coffea arabica TaxID=13443 RepID=A0ABM4UVH1_COFAR
MKKPQTLRDLKEARKEAIAITVFLALIAVLAALVFMNPPSSRSARIHHPRPTSLQTPLSSVIKKACTKTLYSSLCFTTLSSIPPSNATVTFHHVLEFAINQTKEHVLNTQVASVAHFENQELNAQQQNALRDCMEMLDQTTYELEQATDDLHKFPSKRGYIPRSHGYLKILLSAAMTNGYTCIDGLSDLEELGSDGQKDLKGHFENLLTPISHMISNCLAMIAEVEREMSKETLNNPRMLSMKVQEDGFLDWMTVADRKLMETPTELSPNVIVASDGSGDYTRIGEAIANAPDFGTKRYVIKINAGIYGENVVIPREKINLMLTGDGMNSTILIGSKNFVDGYSTFASATLTVVGDKFIAQHLSIINTAGAEKHQAVALRVTSNAAFYRCEMISYQDTLYAHSLRQFYRECSIGGTVDFIFGNAAAIFQNCLILPRKPGPGQRNMITAQGREDPNQNTGMILQNCTIKAAPDFPFQDRKYFPTFLGRPWRNFSRTIIMKSYLDDLINPQGWSVWNQYSRLDTIEYIEYMNTGPGSDTRRRVQWGGYKKNCTEDIERQFAVGAFLHGADNWLESIVFPSLERFLNFILLYIPT